MNAFTRLQPLRIAAGIAWALCTLAAPASATWIATRDFNGWWTDETQNGAALKIKEIADKKLRLNNVAFAPSGDWVVLFGSNACVTSNPALPVAKKIVELQAGSHNVKCIAFTPTGGWVILYDQNGYAFENIPPETQKALEQVAGAGGEFKWIAFAPNGGWCLFHGKNGHEARDVPEECLKRIEQVAAQGSSLETITFAPSGGWAFFFDKGGFYAGGIPRDSFDRLVEMQKSGAPRFIAFSAPAQFDPKATYVMEAKPAHRIHATLSTDIAIPKGQVAEWYLYAPQTPNLPSQHEMATTFEPAGRIVREESVLERPLLLTRIGDHRQEVHTMLTIDGVLYSRQLRALSPGESAPPAETLLPEQVRQFTRASPTCDFETPAFHNWMQTNALTRRADESDLAFAHRVFAFIKHHNTYQWPTNNHIASQVCTASLSDCGGLSALFTAAMRANGIPARMLGGRWATSQKPGEKTGDYGRWHVKAEFFARGIGWVPVDGSSALADPNGENTFFGHDHGDHVAFILDEDMVVESYIAGPKPIPLMQGILYWWRGRGSGDGSRYEDLWTVEQGKL